MAHCSMAIPKCFPKLVPLEQQGRAAFQVVSDITKQPCWFHTEYLEVWLVEAILVPGREHILHVEYVSQTLLHINQWDPECKSEILIFGRPSY